MKFLYLAKIYQEVYSPKDSNCEEYKEFTYDDCTKGKECFLVAKLPFNFL